MTNCKACNQPLPKRVPQPRDVVAISGWTKEPQLGILLDPSLNQLIDTAFNFPRPVGVRVLHLNGPLKGLTSHYAPDRLTVVHGHFHVTERL